MTAATTHFTMFKYTEKSVFNVPILYVITYFKWLHGLESSAFRYAVHLCVCFCVCMIYSFNII